MVATPVEVRTMNVLELMTRSPITVPPEATVDHAMDLMDEHDVRHLPVVHGNRLAGVLSDRDLLEATGWLAPRQREVLEADVVNVAQCMHAAVSVDEEDELTSALEHFVERRVGCLPILRGDELVGVMTDVDIMGAYAQACRSGRIPAEEDTPISDHMTPAPRTIEPDASGDEAHELLRELGVRHLPVVEKGKLVGILSDRDVRRAMGRGRLELSLVRELMSPSPRTAPPDRGLSSVATILRDERISALPIVDHRGLEGIATSLDVTVACARALQQLG